MSICNSSLACSRILKVAAIVFAIQIADSAPGFCQHPELAESISQTGHVWPLRFQAFANHGKYLITESNQGIIVWDVETGQQLMNLETFTTSCQLSPDGILMLYAARGSKFGTLCLHEVGSAKPHLRIDLPEGCDAGSLRFSQGGRFVLARDSAKSLLHVWNSRTGVRLPSPKIPFYDDLRVVQRHAQFEGQSREKVPEGDFGVHQLLLALQTAGPDSRAITLAGTSIPGLTDGYFSPDGKLFVSINWHDTSSSSEDVAVWDVSSGKLLHFFRGPCGSPGQILFHPDGEHYVMGAGFRSAELHRVDTGKVIRKYGELPEAIHAISISVSGEWVIAGTADGQVAVWASDRGEKVAERNLDMSIKSIACAPGGRIASNRTEVKPAFGYRFNHQAPVFTHNGQLVSVHPNGVTVWDLMTSKPLHQFSAKGVGHCFVVYDGALPDDELLVVAPGDRAMLWNITTGAKIQEFASMPTGLSYWNSVRFSEDGRRLFVLHHKEQSVTFWDTATGVLIERHHLINEGKTWLRDARQAR